MNFDIIILLLPVFFNTKSYGAPEAFSCNGNSPLIPLYSWCDGYPDCPGGEDEHNCPGDAHFFPSVDKLAATEATSKEPQVDYYYDKTRPRNVHDRYSSRKKLGRFMSSGSVNLPEYDEEDFQEKFRSSAQETYISLNEHMDGITDYDYLLIQSESNEDQTQIERKTAKNPSISLTKNNRYQKTSFEDKSDRYYDEGHNISNMFHYENVEKDAVSILNHQQPVISTEYYATNHRDSNKNANLEKLNNKEDFMNVNYHEQHQYPQHQQPSYEISYNDYQKHKDVNLKILKQQLQYPQHGLVNQHSDQSTAQSSNKSQDSVEINSGSLGYSKTEENFDFVRDKSVRSLEKWYDMGDLEIEKSRNKPCIDDIEIVGYHMKVTEPSKFDFSAFATQHQTKTNSLTFDKINHELQGKARKLTAIELFKRFTSTMAKPKTREGTKTSTPVHIKTSRTTAYTTTTKSSQATTTTIRTATTSIRDAFRKKIHRDKKLGAKLQ